MCCCCAPTSVELAPCSVMLRAAAGTDRTTTASWTRVVAAGQRIPTGGAGTLPSTTCTVPRAGSTRLASTGLATPLLALISLIVPTAHACTVDAIAKARTLLLCVCVHGTLAEAVVSKHGCCRNKFAVTIRLAPPAQVHAQSMVRANNLPNAPKADASIKVGFLQADQIRGQLCFFVLNTHPKLH